MDEIKISEFGYQTKGNRYFWRINDKIQKDGFKSKKECEEYINVCSSVFGLDYRVGYMVKFKSEDVPWYLVDKNNNEVKI